VLLSGIEHLPLITYLFMTLSYDTPYIGFYYVQEYDRPIGVHKGDYCSIG
jgi:hypothetical protein